MSSVDAASDPPQTVTPSASSPSPVEQPLSQPGPSEPQDSPRDAENVSVPSEVEPCVEPAQVRPVEDANAPAVLEGAPSSELLATSNEPIEGVDAEHAGGMVDESGQWAEDDSHELKRVKVYELIGSRWVDQGTAFCFGDFQDNEALLIARAEEDFNRIILTTTIRATDVYQRQQGA